MHVLSVSGMTRVCVVGSVNMDIGFDVDTLPRPGETALATSVRSTPGGKGANQAVAAARAGADVQFVGAVGRCHRRNAVGRMIVSPSCTAAT